MIFTDKKFWLDATDRAFTTFCQVILTALTAGVSDVVELPNHDILKLAAGAALASVLTSVVFRRPKPQVTP